MASNFFNNVFYFCILITISSQLIIARDNNVIISRKIEETGLVPDVSVKCDTCPCDTCTEPPLPPPVVYYSPPPPPPVYYSPPPPVYPPPPPACPPPPKEPPCNPCMGVYSPPPPKYSYTPGNDLYVTEYGYSGASSRSSNYVFIGVLVFVSVVFLQLSMIL